MFLEALNAIPSYSYAKHMMLIYGKNIEKFTIISPSHSLSLYLSALRILLHA